MQFRECDDGEGAERNCYRRLQWSERLESQSCGDAALLKGGEVPGVVPGCGGTGARSGWCVVGKCSEENCPCRRLESAE